jgi:serine/threonine-protein kinase
LKLIDFGIAKARRTEEQKNLTVAGVVMGTAEYMAPEQARSADKVDARADVYAVGVMLYEMIAGARPVTGEDARVIAHKVERGEVIPLLRAAPDAPRELAGLVHRAMAARPELRFASATDMRRAVEEVVSGKRAGASAMAASLPVPRPASAPPAPSELDPAVHTLRAPPLATALQAPAAYGAPVAPVAPVVPAPPGVRLRRRRGLVAALVALPVLIGGGVVSLLFATGQCGSASEPAPVGPTPPGATSTATPQSLPAATDTKNELPALVPGRPSAPPLPRPQSSSRGSVEAGAPSVASALPDASPPSSPLGLPTAFPSTLPPFPSGFPAGFPTSFPGLPSSFPSAFPGWPPAPPQPAPAPTHGPSSNGAAI